MRGKNQASATGGIRKKKEGEHEKQHITSKETHKQHYETEVCN
jgi:hypothetical protein